MLRKRVIFFIGSTGCMTMLCLCVLAIIARPLQSYMLTLLSILAERSAYPKLNAEKLVDLGSVTGVAFSPDGERILVRGEWRYDEETTEELAHFTLYDKQGNLIVDLGEAEWGYATPEGPILVPMSGSQPIGNLGISLASWKLSFWSWDGKLKQERGEWHGEFPRLIFNSDQSKFVTFRGYGGYGVDAKEEYLWTSDGQQIATLHVPEGNEDGIEGVSFSPDGSLIATPSRAATWLWDENGNLLRTLSLPDDPHVNAEVFFDPNGNNLAVSDDFNHTEIWTIDGQLISILEDVQTLQYSPDGRYLVGKQYVNGYDDEIILFNIENEFASQSLITYDRLYGIRYDETGERFITYGCTDGLSWESGFFCYGGTATLWDKNGNRIADLLGLAEVTAADFVPGSNQTVTAGCDRIVEYSRTIPSYKCLSQSLRLHDDSGKTTAILRDEAGDFWISPNGQLLITTAQRYRGEAILWRLLP